MYKQLIVWGSINGFLAVALGAFGAHGLSGKVSEHMLDNWNTAVQYQMFHAGALFVAAFVSTKMNDERKIRSAAWAFLIGILLFSGSLYVMAPTGITKLGMITPVGGVSFLVGWVLLARAVKR
ncbi:DUF423 domain-containing protein [Massilibacterium senegalense]|uniref:DUF423 domain-containing protein n=1 Tax=Massilibacterium senegalense TaxID=1632858 RepID=UPI00078032A4|nr:DUF423 domain-containing protein [Massilibacterium senegalense]